MIYYSIRKFFEEHLVRMAGVYKYLALCYKENPNDVFTFYDFN